MRGNFATGNKRLIAILGIGVIATALGSSANAACRYTVTNNWGNGFTAAIRITNDTSTPVNGWQVNWAYAKNAVTNSWNARLTGNYTATNLNWNGRIQPGQSVEFGVQGVTNGGAIETPQISGTLCSASASSASSVAPLANNIATLATATTSYVSPWETIRAVNDNSNPANSNDKSAGAYGNWNNPNSIQWVQYTWPQNYQLSGTQIYWFDDNGGVLTPTRAYIEYWNGSAWVNAGNVPLVKNAFNNLALNGVVTNRLRVSMLNTQQSTGILEWRVAGVAAGAISSSRSSAAVSSSVISSSAKSSSSRSSNSSVTQTSSSRSSSSSLVASSSS
ncbi:MAG TPA: cellulose binding domain-containing protein, partial [Cellvibrio sp.]|nr:cellulose binding domain-containing protein [Cellvibrio sp.]